MKKIFTILLVIITACALHAQTIPFTQIQKATGASSVVVTNTAGVMTYTPTLPVSAIPSLPYSPSTRSLTINGTTYDLSANRTWNVGDLLSTGSYSNPSWIVNLPFSKITGVPAYITYSNLSATSPLNYNSSTGVFTITPLTITNTGSGNAVITGNTLNIPNTTYNLTQAGIYSALGYTTQPQLNGTGFVKAIGTTVSYDNSTYLPTTNPVFTGSLTSGATTYTDANTWSQYTGSANNYYQSIWQNTNAGNAASTDLTISNNLGTATTYYGNFGMNSSTYTGTAVFNQPNTVYLTAQNGDLAIGTTSNNAFHVVVNNGTIDAITTSSAGATTITGATTLTGTTTITDANNFIFGATTGTKFGTATTNKLGFWNATPIVQPVATTDLITGLVNVGLRASGTAVPLTTTGAVSFSNTTVTSSLTANTLSVTGTSSLTGTVNTNTLNVNGITTITNNSGVITLREFVGAGVGTTAVYMGTTTPTSINTALAFDGSSTYLNGIANNSLYLSVGGTNVVRLNQSFQIYTPFSASFGAVTPFNFTQPNNSGQTASTVIPGFKHTGNIRGWNGGNIAAIQPEVYFSAPTYSATAASTLSIVTGLLVDAPIAGTNVTFTNKYAVLANGNIGLSAAGNGIYIKEGSNASSGTVTLVAGTITVSNTNITATSRIFLTGNGTTNAGILTKVNSVGTGFTITSTNAADVRAIDYFIIQGN